jgi:hypothetical protein
MLKKLNSLIPIAAFAIATGCVGTIKDNSLHAVKFEPAVQVVPMVAELEVAEQKSMGRAKGKRDFKELLEKEAVAEALAKSNGDVLVGVSYFYEYSDSLMVTVIGYPARYKNFRPKDVSAPEAELVDFSISIKNAKQPGVQAPKSHEIAAPVAPHAAPAAGHP